MKKVRMKWGIATLVFMLMLTGCSMPGAEGGRNSTGSSDGNISSSSEGNVGSNSDGKVSGNSEVVQEADGTELRGENGEQIITLGTIWVSDDLAEVVAAFNESHDELQVQVVSYWDEEKGYEAGIEQLKLDVVTGKAPDIIEVSDAYMGMLVEKGVFADLYTFMETDAECSRDMLVENILKLYERDGHLYSIAPAFYLYSLWGSSSVVQGRYGISLEELQEILAENGKDLSAVHGFFADTPVLETLCTFGMDELIDWEQGTCDFEGEYFRDILQFAKEYEEAKAAAGEVTGSMAERVQRGEVLFSGGMLCSVTDYQIQREIFGGELETIGYPTADGTGTAASFWGSQIAINVASTHQEEAWEFVKSFVLNGYDEVGFSLVKERFEAALQQSMEKMYSLSEDGAIQVEVAKGSYPVGDDNIYIYEAAEEDVAAVRWMVENASQRMQCYMDVQDIITEDAGSYLQGKKSLEETAALIQNRVTLYLQEQVW